MEIDRRLCGRRQAEAGGPRGGRGTGDSTVKDGGSFLLLISGIIKYFESRALRLPALLDGSAAPSHWAVYFPVRTTRSDRDSREGHREMTGPKNPAVISPGGRRG